MFDQDRRTAWVYSGGFGDWRAEVDATGSRKKKPMKTVPLRNRYWIQLTPSKGKRIDEIRLMNGYNKDSFTFGRNARISRIEVFAMNGYGTASGDKKKIGAFHLKDAMGWHSLKIPSRRYSSLRIEVTDLNRGTDPDVAISEMQLLSHGRNVGPQRASFVVFNPGDECGCGGEDRLVGSNGAVLATTSSELEGIAQSRSGRYFSGGDYSPAEKVVTMWVFDTRSRRKVWTRRYPDPGYPHAAFDDHDRLSVVEFGPDEKQTPKSVLWSPARSR